MTGPTKDQKKLLDFLRSYISAHGFSPTYDEMAEALGSRSKGNMARMVKCLEDRGLIRKRFGYRRAIEVVDSEQRDLASIVERYLPTLRSTVPLMAREFEEWKERNSESL